MAAKQKEVDLLCEDCAHKWRQGHRQRRQCPECESMNVSLLEVSLLTSKKTEGEGNKEEKAKEKKKEAKEKAVTGTPLVQTIPKQTKSVDVDNRPMQEEQFAALLVDLGVKQADLLSSIIMNSDSAEDPKYIDDTLREFRIPYYLRKLALRAWCSKQGIEQYEVAKDLEKAKAGEDEEDLLDDVLAPIEKLQLRKLRMKMVKDMLREDDGRLPAHTPSTSQESMVPLYNDDGTPVLDSTGKQAMVPATVWLMREQAKARQQQEAQPHPVEMALNLATDMFDKWIAMMNPQGNAAAQQQVALLQAQNQNLQAMKPLEKQMSELQSEVLKRQALEVQKAEYGKVLGEYQKQIEELRRQNEKLSDDRLRSYEDTQIQMQQQMNQLMVETGKGFTSEFRETRKDVKDLVKEQWKQDRMVEGVRARQQQYSPVQELTVEQMEQEVGGVGGVPMLDGGVEVLDPRLLEAPVEAGTTKRGRGQG